jgi:hypothetical protein
MPCASARLAASILAFYGYSGGDSGIKGRERVERNKASVERSGGGDKLNPNKGPIFGPIYF